MHCLQSGLQEQGSKCFLLPRLFPRRGLLQVYQSPQGAEISGCRRSGLQLQPQVRVWHGFTGTSSLKGEATVFSNWRWRKPQGGAVLLYDGPEDRREGELSGQHSYNRLVRWVAVALPCHEGEKWRGVKSEGAPWNIRVWRSERWADSPSFIHMRERRRTATRRDVAVGVWCGDLLFVFGPDFLASHAAAMRCLLHAVVSGERGAPLTFAKLCPPVLEPHLDEQTAKVDLFIQHSSYSRHFQRALQTELCEAPVKDWIKNANICGNLEGILVWKWK